MNFLDLVSINITLRKCLLNKLLTMLSPTNKIVIFLSQDLDKYIVLYQKVLVNTYYGTDKKSIYEISKNLVA